jgi:hypothetical protein
MIGRKENVGEGPSPERGFAALAYAFFLFYAVGRIASRLIENGSSRTQILVYDQILLPFLPTLCRNTMILHSDRCNDTPYFRHEESAQQH